MPDDVETQEVSDESAENDDAFAQEALAEAAKLIDQENDSSTELPDYAKRQISKANREAQNLRKRLETQSQSWQKRLENLEKQLTDREARDLERQSQIALTKVHTELAEAGLKRDDISGLLELIDSKSLLTDGEPNGEAISKLAQSLTRIAGRTTPDLDQGRKGGESPVDMNALLRRAVGRGMS